MSDDKRNSRDREMEVLNRIAMVMADFHDLAGIAPIILKVLGEAFAMRNATLSLVDSATGEICIDCGDGLSTEQIRRGHYAMGEGIVGGVAASGVAAIVPSIRSNPNFLNKTGLRSGDASFICVPLKVGDEVLGTLSVDGETRSMDALEEDARLLGMVATMMAQAAKARQREKERQEKLVDENKRLRSELRRQTQSQRLIGKSREMQIILDQIAQVADSPSTVLILGETGTGKELVARALHYNGQRAEGPFVRVNCAALPETLIESELFGHEKGAFTGAVASRKGRFEEANEGTIFIDEIGELSPVMQVKLLRVLQEREFERVGGNKTIKVDVRVVAATHRDLQAMVSQGTFRKDLYYRVNVFPIHLLPLRQRIIDIPLLAEYFLKKYATAAGKAIASFSPEVLDIFAEHSWPGNVRELENSIEHAVILANGPVILPEHLPLELRRGGLPNAAAEQEPEADADADYKTLVDDFERRVLTRALQETGGNITKTAKRLHATTRVISYRIRQLGIDILQFEK